MSKSDDYFSGQQQADYEAADKSRLELRAAKKRIEELETGMRKLIEAYRRYGGNDFDFAAGDLEDLLEAE